MCIFHKQNQRKILIVQQPRFNYIFNNLYIKVYFLLIMINSICFSQIIENNQIKAEIEKFRNNQQEILEKNNQLETESLNAPSEVTVRALNQDNNTSRISEHFGYDYFTARDSVSFWENMPATSNYVIGPGDEIVVSIWGENQIRRSYVISRDGNIYDDEVGLLIISGKSVDELKSYLKSQFGRVYDTLNGSNPSSFIDVTLGDFGSINVNFVGQVKYPGIYPLHPFSTVLTGLVKIEELTLRARYEILL